MSLSIGQVLNNRYRIDGLLGQGGMGAVYRALDLNLNIPLAVKENLDASPEAQKQFGREAGLLARLAHPNLPRVTDYFFIPGQGQYLVMDFIEGEDLQAMLDRLGALPEPHVLNWSSQVCDALAYLHSQPSPIIHRDIKPANIKIRTDGRAMLVDFGIAKVYDPNLSTTFGAKAITPGYSPPEQYGGGTTDARSDIYALGATLYHLLTGHKLPESLQRMVGNATLPPPRQLNQQISPMAEQAVLKAIEVATDRRFQSVDELQAALTQPTLQKLVKPQPSPDSYPVPQQPTVVMPRARQSSRWLWLGLPGAGLVLVVVIVTALARSSGFGGVRPTSTRAVAALSTQTPIPATSDQMATPMPQPTDASRPILSPTAATFSTLYDDFNAASYDGRYDSSLWHDWGADMGPGAKIGQRDGVMVLSVSPQSDKPGPTLQINGYFSLAAFKFAQAKVMMLQADRKGDKAFFHIQVGTKDKSYPAWFGQCSMGSNSASSPLYSLLSMSDGMPIVTKTAAATYDTWHTLRLELDADTAMVRCYLDGKLVDAYASQTAAKLKDANSYLDITLSAAPNTAAAAQVDEFRIGR